MMNSVANSSNAARFYRAYGPAPEVDRATAKSVNIIHDDASATKMASIRANLPDPTNATYFSWRGPTTAGSAAYYRIQGPKLFIEWAPQAMGGAATNHIHAMYRELANDYGALIPQ